MRDAVAHGAGAEDCNGLNGFSGLQVGHKGVSDDFAV